jgi:hypothetical protein
MLTTRADCETFFTVTTWSGDTEPNVTSPKSKPVGEMRKGDAAMPLPLKVKLNG